MENDEERQRKKEEKNGPYNLINTNRIIHMLAHKLFEWFVGMVFLIFINESEKAQ